MLRSRSTRLVQKLLRHMYINMRTVALAYEIHNKMLLPSCKVILIHTFGLVASTFLLLLP